MFYTAPKSSPCVSHVSRSEDMAFKALRPLLLLFLPDPALNISFLLVYVASVVSNLVVTGYLYESVTSLSCFIIVSLLLEEESREVDGLGSGIGGGLEGNSGLETEKSDK